MMGGKYDYDYFERQFAEKSDPWDYRTEPCRQLRHLRTYDLIRGMRFSHVLEIGCAGGVFTSYLSGLCDRLDALDISASAIERNRIEARLANVSWRQLDFFAEYASLEYSEYDLIAGMSVLHYAPKDVQRAMFRHLSVNSSAKLLMNYRVDYGVKGDSGDYAFTMDELLRELSDAGYRIDTIAATEIVPFAFGRGIFKDAGTESERRLNYLYEKERLLDCGRLLQMGAMPYDVADVSFLATGAKAEVEVG